MLPGLYVRGPEPLAISYDNCFAELVVLVARGRHLKVEFKYSAYSMLAA